MTARSSGQHVSQNVHQHPHQHSHTHATATAATVQLSQSFSVVDAFDENDPPVYNNSSMSSLSDISSATSAVSRRSKWMSRHNRQLCFHCCRLNANRSTDAAAAAAAGTATVAATIPKRRFSAPLSPPPVALLLQQQQQSTPTTGGSVSNSSSDFSDAADRIGESILRHVQRMANPVWSKQSKMALLELKQKHGAAYQDVCLYAEVCRALAANTYRLQARRFLQELFLDLRFDAFGQRAADTFARHEDELLQRVAAETNLSAADNTVAMTTATAANVGYSGSADRQQQRSTSGSFEMRNASTVPNDQQHVYATVKTLRHSLLPSVTEASVENLADSLGNKSRHMSIG